MKTTITTNTVNTTAEEILKAFKGANGSFITITSNTIEELKQNGDIVQIAERQGRKGGNNIYYSCSKLNNTVLMHVKNDMYTVINRYVYCKRLNRMIDTIPVLTQFGFCSGRTNSNRCSIMAWTPANLREQGFGATLYFTRVIASLEKYGELRPLASDHDVHHKGDCWDNRQAMTMYIPSSMHKHRNNHMTGRLIATYSEFMWLCNYLKTQYAILYNETKIA